MLQIGTIIWISRVTLTTAYCWARYAILSYSQKQKINTKNSTELELSRVIWRLYLKEAQGYSIDQNIAFQDNMATMRLEVNGAMISSKRTKHINARYFMVKDRIDEGELEVQ